MSAIRALKEAKHQLFLSWKSLLNYQSRVLYDDRLRPYHDDFQ